jgi:hypothetical protein
MIGISKIGLTESLDDGPITVDAAEVNPVVNALAVKKAASKKVSSKK